MCPDRFLRVRWNEHPHTKASELVRHVLCFDRKTGKKLWHKEFPAPLPENDLFAGLRS